MQKCHLNVTLILQTRKMKCIILLLGCLLLGLGFYACAPKHSKKVILLQTGRMAGNVYPTEMRNIAPLQYYPYLAAYVAQVRAQALIDGDEVILIDSGDSLLGSFASYTTQAQNMVTLFNELNYDTIFLGNLDANIEESMLSQLKAPVLIPFTRGDLVPALTGAKLSLKLKRKEIELLLLPNFYGITSKAEFPERFPVWFGTGLGEVEPLRDYEKLLATLSPLTGQELVIFHWMKFEDPKAVPPSYLTQLGAWGVDVILAHSVYGKVTPDKWRHRGFPGWPIPVSENILRQNRGFTLARLDLVRDGSSWKQEGDALVIPLNANAAPPDQGIIQKMSAYKKAIQEADEVLGEIQAPVSEEDLLKFHLTFLGNIPGANLVLYSPASVRNGLDAGKLTASRLYEAVPWTKELNLIELTPEQYTQLKKLKGYALLSKPSAERKPLIVSSRYFTQVLKSILNLQDSQIQPTAEKNEFEFIKRQIKATGLMPSAQVDMGEWKYEKLE